jgi:hypothetical protein
MGWFRGLPRPRRVAVLAAVAVVVMGLGAILAGGGGDEPPGTSTDSVATGPDRAGGEPPAGPGPAEVSAGVGVGFSEDEAGAVAAAVSYAIAPQAWLYLSDEDAAASAEAIVLPDAREEIVGDVVQEVGLLRDELASSSGTVWFVVSPLATRVEDFDETSGRAVVRVWTMRVLSAEGVAVPQSGWQTLTFNLRWHAGDWKIASMDEADGPVPQLEAGLQPWTSDYLAGELEGFSRVGGTS